VRVVSGDTVFHKILNNQIPADRIYEDDRCIVIRDMRPVAPLHLLCIPKKFLPDLSHATDEDNALLGHLLLIIRQVAKDEGVSDSGYRVAINAGSDSGMEVPYLHLHLIGGKKLGGIG
jgi:histidine triad (HIT) family protein